jgi:hypothetical protein
LRRAPVFSRFRTGGFGFCALADVFPSSSIPADVNQQKSKDGDVSAPLDGDVVIISV